MPFTVGILAQCHLCNRLPILRKRLHHLPIGILNAIFSPTGTLSPARRIVNTPRDELLEPRGFPRNLALRSVQSCSMQRSTSMSYTRLSRRGRSTEAGASRCEDRKC